MYNDIIRNNKHKVENNFLLSLDNGIQIDIVAKKEESFIVEFWEGEKLIYSTKINGGMFARPTVQYFLKWKCIVKNLKGEILFEHSINLREKNVLVYLDTMSLGDTLAWFPQVYEFAKLHKCNLFCKTFFNKLIEKNYPNVNFIHPSENVENIYASYSIGYFYGEDLYKYTPIDPRTIPLAKTASSILGIPYEERKVNLLHKWNFKNTKKVCIATHSTAKAKYWLRENGWQDIIDYLNMTGYEVIVINKEKNEYKNVIDLSGNFPLEKRIESLLDCDFFIGLGSGLSWLAWTLEVPVILISGFSAPFAEFSCYRVHNKNVCNSCWNDTTFRFDKGDFEWCPRKKDTEKFECTKQLSSISVIKEIINIENDYSR